MEHSDKVALYILICASSQCRCNLKQSIGQRNVSRLTLRTITVSALSVLCGGDGLANVVGRRPGAGNKLWLCQNKSIAGSADMI